MVTLTSPSAQLDVHDDRWFSSSRPLSRHSRGLGSPGRALILSYCIETRTISVYDLDLVSYKPDFFFEIKLDDITTHSTGIDLRKSSVLLAGSYQYYTDGLDINP